MGIANMIKFFVDGIPAPQGSKKAFKRGKKIVLVEMSERLPEWREQVAKVAAEHAPDEPLDCALTVHMDFYLPEPKRSRFKDFPAGVPDADKLARAVNDGITAGKVWVDDSRVVALHVRKHWARTDFGDPAGVHVSIEPLSAPTGGDSRR